jgi:GT2 family glycosyltransferase
LNFDLKTYPDDVFVVCPDVITIEGVHQNPHVLKPRTTMQRLKLDLYFSHYYVACILLYFKRLLSPLFKKTNTIYYSKAGYLHMGIGACYILLPVFLSKFKHLDFPHFLYGEEAYLSLQVRNAGGALFYDPSLRVQHKESATLSKLPKIKTYHLGRDGYWSYRKFY